MSIRVTVWNEYVHEVQHPAIARVYPKGIHEAIAEHLRQNPQLAVSTATLEQPEHGLTEAVVKNTDVFIWWGHMAHDKVADNVVQRVHDRVLGGAGLVVLHSGHFSKIFRKLMGTSCDLKWREDDRDREILWVTRPGHPIVRDIDNYFMLPHEEMYGEFFDIPEPECTFLISSFSGGEVFRSGCTWTRGLGRVVYFRPGHEAFPTYYDKNVQKVIANAVLWAAPTPPPAAPSFGNRKWGWIEQK